MQPQHSSQARLLAPAALAVFAVAFFAIVLGSGSSDGDGGDEAPASGSRPAATARQQSRERPQERGTYTVKTGDTLGGISQKTGVPVEQLQELNPELDPQALVSGQKIKLRE
jgi:LysM repeat protein